MSDSFWYSSENGSRKLRVDASKVTPAECVRLMHILHGDLTSRIARLEADVDFLRGAQSVFTMGSEMTTDAFNKLRDNVVQLKSSVERLQSSVEHFQSSVDK